MEMGSPSYTVVGALRDREAATTSWPFPFFIHPRPILPFCFYLGLGSRTTPASSKQRSFLVTVAPTGGWVGSRASESCDLTWKAWFTTSAASRRVWGCVRGVPSEFHAPLTGIPYRRRASGLLEQGRRTCLQLRRARICGTHALMLFQ